MDELIAHYRQTELCDRSAKTTLTKQVYAHHLTKVISPRWGAYRLRDVKPHAVEEWLSKFQVAPGTKAKTKGVMSILFTARHALQMGDSESHSARASERLALA